MAPGTAKAECPMTHPRMALQHLYVVFATLLLTGAAEACTKNEDLLQEADLSSALALTPCDPIGSLYLDGLSGDRFFSFAETQKLGTDHIFYGFARMYFSTLARLPDLNADFENFDDAYASLMMAVYLSRSNDTVSEDRRTAYSAYAKLAFAQYADLRGTAQSMLVAAIEEEIATSKLATRRHVFCFVRHDMPEFTVDKITDSKAFAGCMAEE